MYLVAALSVEEKVLGSDTPVYNKYMRTTSLSQREIEIIVRELAELVCGGTVSNLFQFDRKKLVLSIEKRAYGHNLLISLQPPHVRMHLTGMKLRKLKNRLPFGEYLKKELLETRLVDISQVDNDRIVRLDFESECKISLVVELFSRGGGVYLTDDDGIIKASLKGSRIGEKYAHKSSQIPDELDVEVPEGQLLNFILDDKYRKIEEALEFEHKKKHILAHLQKKKKKLEKLFANLGKDLEKCRQWERFNLYGELLKANLNKLKENSPSVKVLNYYTNEEIEIPLDKKVPPQVNMEKYFRKAKKLRRGLKVIERNMERAEKRFAPLNEQIVAVEGVENLDDLEACVSAHRIKVPLIETRRPQKKKRLPSPFRYFISRTGLKIYVGRSNQENDRLTMSFGKGSDFWCHADGYPGSHVLVPLPKNTEIDHQTFLDAVNLALYHSKAKNSGAGDILYTERRYVSKTKGLSPGKVNVSRHKVIHVKLDEERIRDIRERTQEEVG